MFPALSAHLQDDKLHTCSIWYCHSLREYVVACRYTAWVRTGILELMMLVYSVADGCVFCFLAFWVGTFYFYAAVSRCQAVYRQATRNSHRQWQYHMLHVRVYNCILLKMSSCRSKHVEENSILWINNNQCIKLVINLLKPNDIYICRTAALTSRRYILNIYSTIYILNILNMLHNLRFFLFKMPFIS